MHASSRHLLTVIPVLPVPSPSFFIHRLNTQTPPLEALEQQVSVQGRANCKAADKEAKEVAEMVEFLTTERIVQAECAAEASEDLRVRAEASLAELSEACLVWQQLTAATQEQLRVTALESQAWCSSYLAAVNQSLLDKETLFHKDQHIATLQMTQDLFTVTLASSWAEASLLQGAVNSTLGLLGLSEGQVGYVAGSFILLGTPQEAAAALRRAADQLVDMVVVA